MRRPVWADTIPIAVGPWVVGIRVDTQSGSRDVAAHLSDRLVEVPDAPSNYTIVAPHVLKGHGTLFRAGEPILESRRMRKLLEALDAELSTLLVPTGMIRVTAVATSGPAGVVLEPRRRDADLEPSTNRMSVWWVDPESLELVDPTNGRREPLAGVLVRSTMRHEYWLMELVTPGTPEANNSWMEVLAELSRSERLATVRDPQESLTTIARWTRSV